MKNSLIIGWTLLTVTIAVFFVAWCALFLLRFDIYFVFAVPAWASVPGLVLFALGGVMVLICGGILSTRRILRSEDRLFPKEFAVSGPFQYLRNPMSLGVVTLMLGLGLYKRSPSVLLLTGGMFVILHLVAVHVEEPGLEKRFGASYQAYKRSVNRWIPKIKR